MISNIQEKAQKVICKYYTILRKGLEFLRYWYLEGSWHQSSVDTQGCLLMNKKSGILALKWKGGQMRSKTESRDCLGGCGRV